MQRLPWKSPLQTKTLAEAEGGDGQTFIDSGITLTLQSLLFAKEQGAPEKSEDFPICRTPNLLGKREPKRTKRARKTAKRKKQGNQKKQGLEGQGTRTLRY